MECIICKDNNSEPIHENIHCSCKYQYHTSCWIDYINSKVHISCPLCRKDLTIKTSHKISLPYSLNTDLEQQISYQEFVDRIQEYNLNQNNTINMQPHSPVLNNNISKKILRVNGFFENPHTPNLNPLSIFVHFRS